MADNVVSGATAGLASNFSTGVRVVGNRVAGCGTGIHTDNAGGAAGASADVLEDNVVTACTKDGYGLFVFVPSLGVTVRGNRVVGCTVGIAAFGEGAPVETRFVGNRIDALGQPDTTGIYVTTSEVDFGSSNVHVLRHAQRDRGRGRFGILLAQESGFTTTADVQCNALSGDTERSRHRVGGEHGRAQCDRGRSRRPRREQPDGVDVRRAEQLVRLRRGDREAPGAVP